MSSAPWVIRCFDGREEEKREVGVRLDFPDESTLEYFILRCGGEKTKNLPFTLMSYSKDSCAFYVVGKAHSFVRFRCASVEGCYK